MKQTLIVFLSLCIIVMCCCPIGAIENDLSTEIALQESSTPDDLGHQIAAIMQTYFDDPEGTKSALNSIGVDLLDEPQIISYNSTNQERGLNPTDYTLSVYSARRAGSKNTYLMWSLQANKTELFPGPLDYISMEWDTEYASYYSSTGDDVFSTVQGRDDGIVLFNVQDNDLDKNESTYGYVIVSPKKTGWMEYGSKYVHTYTKFLFGGSASASFSPSTEVSDSGEMSLNLAYTMGFTVTVGANTAQWQIWNDNAVDLD